MATQESIPVKGEEPELEEAVATLWAGFDNMTQLLMMTVDMFEVAQQDGRRIDVPKLRKALGEQVREAISERNRVLTPLGIDAEEGN